MQLLKISEYIVVSTMPSLYMAGYSRRYAREAFLVGRGTVGGGLSVSKLRKESLEQISKLCEREKRSLEQMSKLCEREKRSLEQVSKLYYHCVVVAAPLG